MHSQKQTFLSQCLACRVWGQVQWLQLLVKKSVKSIFPGSSAGDANPGAPHSEFRVVSSPWHWKSFQDYKTQQRKQNSGFNFLPVWKKIRRQQGYWRLEEAEIGSVMILMWWKLSYIGLIQDPEGRVFLLKSWMKAI